MSTQEQTIPIRCHDRDGFASIGLKHHCGENGAATPGMHWCKPDEHRPFRHCSYCGSMHPFDLIELLEASKIKLSGSDWKYGWPHKFYIDGLGGLKLWGKWYNKHLYDLDGELFAKLAKLLDTHTNILFEPKDSNGKFSYLAPYAGYQKY